MTLKALFFPHTGLDVIEQSLGRADRYLRLDRSLPYLIRLRILGRGIVFNGASRSN